MIQPLPPDKLAELQQMLRRNEKIPAIKLYRECTGAGLADAKNAVEAMEAGAIPPPADSCANNAGVPVEIMSRLQDLIFRGETIAAIKLHREHSGSGLAQAKAAVEAMERMLRASSPHKFMAPPRKAGCVGMIVGLVSLGGGVLALVWLWTRHL